MFRRPIEVDNDPVEPPRAGLVEAIFTFDHVSSFVTTAVQITEPASKRLGSPPAPRKVSEAVKLLENLDFSACNLLKASRRKIEISIDSQLLRLFGPSHHIFSFFATGRLRLPAAKTRLVRGVGVENSKTFREVSGGAESRTSWIESLLDKNVS
jgi:hypothetical protein